MCWLWRLGVGLQQDKHINVGNAVKRFHICFGKLWHHMGKRGPQFCWEGNLKANCNVDCPRGNSEASGRCLFFWDQVRWKFFYSSNSCRKIWPWLRSRQVSMDCIYQMWDWNVTSYILDLVFGQVQINWISSMFEVFVSTLAWNTDIICRVQSFSQEEGKVLGENIQKVDW